MGRAVSKAWGAKGQQEVGTACMHEVAAFPPHWGWALIRYLLHVQ